MELPARPAGDRSLAPGAHRRVRSLLRPRLGARPLTAVLFHCFDRRTRLLPFVFADVRMVPAGVRQVAASLLDAGAADVRIVLQQWTPHVRPSEVSLGGRRPDLLLFSAMSLHTEPLERLLADACRIPPRERPLVVCGGPKAIYEAHELFHVARDPSVDADLACRGEEFVFLEALERLTRERGAAESLRDAFLRVRSAGSLDDVPGLTYLDGEGSLAGRLVDTGPQRLLDDLDELPMAVAAYERLEPPHGNRALAPRPLSLARAVRRAPIASLEITRGCRLTCDYCPIPAYNQKGFRQKSGRRVAEEMHALARVGLRAFFGTDDNFFDRRPAAREILETVARYRHDRRGDRTVVWRWGTEATLTDTHRCLDLLPAARASGMQALWFGIEDLTATLVRKGQSPTKTETVFRELQANAILPMPMLMHSDGQPLSTRGSLAGLLQQVRFVRRCGGGALALFHHTPALGTRSYEGAFEKGLVFERVGRDRVEPWRFDGGHVVSGGEPAPWRRQLNLLAGYAAFYNPLQLLLGPLRRPRRQLVPMDVGLQLIGMAGLVPTALAGIRWARALRRGPIERSASAPRPALPVAPPAPRPEPPG